MSPDVTHQSLVCIMSSPTADDAHIRSKRTELWVPALGHRRDTRVLSGGVCQDREIGDPSPFRVTFHLLKRSWLIRPHPIKREGEGEWLANLFLKGTFFSLEAPGLTGATRSPSGRHVHDEVLTVKVPKRDLLAALVGELDILHNIPDPSAIRH